MDDFVSLFIILLFIAAIIAMIYLAFRIVMIKEEIKGKLLEFENFKSYQSNLNNYYNTQLSLLESDIRNKNI